MDSLYIVMPAYNEEENIEQTIKAWYPILERKDVSADSKLVIADSGSTDKTHKMIEDMKVKYPKV